MEIKNSWSQIILYAKGHFKENDRMEDLRILFANRSGIEATYISNRDIICNLINMVGKYHEGERTLDDFLLDFISDIDPAKDIRYYALVGKEAPKYNFYDSVVSKCLSLIRFLGISNDIEVLIELDEANYELLEMSDFIKERLEKEKENEKQD